VVAEYFVFLLVKLKNFMKKSKEIMLVWVIDIMCKSLLLEALELFYYDNLIKCNTISKRYKFFDKRDEIFSFD